MFYYFGSQLAKVWKNGFSSFFKLVKISYVSE